MSGIFRSAFFGLFLLSLLACSNTDLQRPKRFGNFSQNLETLNAYRELKFNKDYLAKGKAKIFLIAGSEENANFAQEIIEQKLYWLDQGFKAEEIVCFYAMPSNYSYQEDRAQYSILKSHLADCQHANAKDIFEAIHESGKAGHDFLYLYATSHGNNPFTEILKEKKLNLGTRLFLDGFVQDYPVLGDQYMLTVDGSPTGKTASLPALASEYKAGAKPEDLFFTPRYLKAALSSWPDDVTKYIVLQACHSGGFVRDPRPDFQKDLLSSIPNLVAMTASRYDRSSFGCDSGSYRTFFGGAFNDTLLRAEENPDQIRWPAFYRSIKRQVERLEKEKEVKTPSLPDFIDTRESGSEVKEESPLKEGSVDVGPGSGDELNENEVGEPTDPE
ncbi:MAG: C13 family peptidase [Bdellovibrionota bacterium]